jgi:hypothetical protein
VRIPHLCGLVAHFGSAQKKSSPRVLSNHQDYLCNAREHDALNQIKQTHSATAKVALVEIKTSRVVEWMVPQSSSTIRRRSGCTLHRRQFHRLLNAKEDTASPMCRLGQRRLTAAG